MPPHLLDYYLFSPQCHGDTSVILNDGQLVLYFTWPLPVTLLRVYEIILCTTKLNSKAGITGYRATISFFEYIQQIDQNQTDHNNWGKLLGSMLQLKDGFLHVQIFLHNLSFFPIQRHEGVSAKKGPRA